MHVQRQIGRAADGLHHRNANAQIGHEMAVHNVDVQAPFTGLFDAANLLAEPGKIARQQRRRGTSRRSQRANRPESANKTYNKAQDLVGKTDSGRSDFNEMLRYSAQWGFAHLLA